MTTKRGRKPKGCERMDQMVSALVDAAMKTQLRDAAREQHVGEAHVIREALRAHLATLAERRKVA
jgi:hypothetical protein